MEHGRGSVCIVPLQAISYRDRVLLADCYWLSFTGSLAGLPAQNSRRATAQHELGNAAFGAITVTLKGRRNTAKGREDEE